MDNPRFAFFFDEILFWRLAAGLSLVLLLVFSIVLTFNSQVDQIWKGWYSIPVAIQPEKMADYQYQIQASLPPMKLDVLKEIQNQP